MQLNKKGMTLIELLITIVFVGMILVFMFSLLNYQLNICIYNYDYKFRKFG